MDKPSDVVLRPFSLPGDEAAVLEDWKREHPQEAEMMRQYPSDRSEAELAAMRYEQAQRDRERLLAGGGQWPESSWERPDLPQSSAAREVEAQQAEVRRAAQGGLPDAPGEALAVERRPFRL